MNRLPPFCLLFLILLFAAISRSNIEDYSCRQHSAFHNIMIPSTKVRIGCGGILDKRNLDLPTLRQVIDDISL